jgi:long-chain acyl-CoA synthetase
MAPKPWLDHYDAGVPATLQPYPRQTLMDVVSETARLRPAHPAMIFKGERISYGELEWRSNALAAALVAEGVKKGDRVAILMPNCPQYLIAELAIWKAGGIVAAINPLYTESELEHAIQECGAETAIVLTLFYNKVKAVQAKTPLKRVIATNIREYLPKLLMLLFMLAKEKKEGHRIQLQDGDRWFNELIRQHTGAPQPKVDILPEDPGLILFTGGTTGVSKAAYATHQALVIAGLQIRAWFSSMLVEWDDCFLGCLPLFHVFAAVGLQSVALLGRSPIVVIPNPRDIDDVVANIEKTRPTFMPGVPTLFIALLNHPAVKARKVDMTSIKLCISGAAPLMLDTKERFEAATGGRIVEGYALTESMMAAVISPVKGKYKPGFVGMPISDVEIRIVDADHAQTDMPLGEIGEIALRAPQVMLGYWARPEATTEILRDGWLYTGDLGYLDPDGYLTIVDRKKDLIKPSGFQVWPREVEEAIAKHPAVAEVGVIGVPDPRQGEAVKAFVVLREGQTATADEIRDFCKASLAGYKVPRQVEFRTSLPKSAVGKVLRRELAK